MLSTKPGAAGRALAGLATACALGSCRSPTEINVVVRTDFPCSDLRHVDVMVGTLGDDLERNRPPTTTSTTCTDGYVGKLVVVPHDGSDAEVGIKVVAGFASRDAEQCVPAAGAPPAYGSGCIVERRALRYLPHTALTVNVVMYASCDGVACNVTETCNAGRCVPAAIADNTTCQGAGCSDPPVDHPSGGDAGTDAGAGSLAASCGDMSGLQAGAPWPMSGFCPTRRGRSPYVGAQTSTVKWTLSATPSSEIAVAADGTLYYGAYDGKLHAANPQGAELWAFPTATADAVLGSPAIAADGTVYFGAQDHHLYAVTPAGKQRWAYPCGDLVSTPSVGADGTVYFTSKEHVVHAVDAQGKKVWEAVVGGSDLYAQPVLSVDGATLYLADYDGSLYALTSSKGAPLWHFDTPAGLAQNPAVAPDGTIYFGAADKNVYALSPDGKKKWAYLTGDAVSAGPALGADGTVYATSSDGKLYAIDPQGRGLWSYASPRLVTTSPTVGADGTIYFMAADGASGGIFVVDAHGKAKWDNQLENDEVTPSIGRDGTVYGGVQAFGP